jgi:hypothetical protein
MTAMKVCGVEETKAAPWGRPSRRLNAILRKFWERARPVIWRLFHDGIKPLLTCFLFRVAPRWWHAEYGFKRASLFADMKPDSLFSFHIELVVYTVLVGCALHEEKSYIYMLMFHKCNKY